MSYISAGLYSVYPCKSNLLGDGDLFEQCQMNVDLLTEEDYEQYHAVHPTHGNCYFDKHTDDDEHSAWTTLQKVWDKYGPIKHSDIFSCSRVPVEERIRLANVKGCDVSVWNNLLDVWMESVFAKLPYVLVFDRYGKKRMMHA